MDQRRLLISETPWTVPSRKRTTPFVLFVLTCRMLYRPGDLPRRTLDDVASFSKGFNTKFSFQHCTTLQAATKLAQNGEDIAVLNFASAKNPGMHPLSWHLTLLGGGFLRGSLAQEESLARASGLYDCLTLERVSGFYSDNSRDKTCLYTHNIIYSPGVPVFRDDSTHELLEEPVLLSFISSPAVNAGHALERVGDPAKVAAVMEERMERVLAVAALHNHKHIILGAWGCGVFANSVTEIALMWRKFLLDGKFKDTFEQVVFAITDEKVVKTFEEVLNPNNSMDSFVVSPPAVGRGRGAPSRSNEHKRGRGGRGRGADRKFENLQKHQPGEW